jgi:hypothetical protein
VDAGRDIRGNVSAIRGIGHVRAGGSIVGSVTAGDSIGLLGCPGVHISWGPNSVRASGDIAGTLTAGLDIGHVWAGGTFRGTVHAGRDLESVGAGTDVAGDVTAGGDVWAVGSSGNVSGHILAGGAVGYVDAGGSISGTIEAGTDIGAAGGYGRGVAARLDITGTLTAGGDITGVTADRDLGGTIHAGRDLPLLSAGRTLSATVTAGGDIGPVTAAGDISGSITAGGGVRRVVAGTWYGYSASFSPPDPLPMLGSVTGSITAGGAIDHVLASGHISGSIRAGTALGTVTAAGDISGRLTAGTGIGEGYLTNDLDPWFHPVGCYGPDGTWFGLPNGQWYYWPWYAWYGIDAGRDFAGSATAIAEDIARVTARRDLGGTIHAGRDLPWLSAARHVTATVTAGRDIGEVTAGLLPPNFVGPILEPGGVFGYLHAGRDIYSVSATGNVGNIFAGDPGPVAALQGGGFEAPNVGSGNYVAFQYDPAGTPWTFSGHAGVSGNGSGFTSGNPGAPEGGQVAFLQSYRQATGSISQTVTLDAGTYSVSFQAARRANNGGAQTFQVLIDGTAIGTFTPASTSYVGYQTAAFSVAAGSHTLSFQSLSANGGDNTAFLDAVQLIDIGDARGDIGAWIEAGHGIGRLAAGGRLTGTISAGASIGTLADPDSYSLLDGPATWLGLWPSSWPYQAASFGIYAGRDLMASVTAGGDIVAVAAGGLEPEASLSAGRDIGWVRATGASYAEIHAGRDLIGVWAGGNVDGALGAAHDLHWVDTRGDVQASLSAGHGIAGVNAGGSIVGGLSAGASIGHLRDRDELPPQPPTWDWADWYFYYGWPSLLRPTAVAGVHAGRDVSGSISANDDVGPVTSGHNIGGVIRAGRDIAPLNAINDLTGTITADRFLGAITAGHDVNGQEIRAGDGPVDVTAVHDIKLDKLVSVKDSVTADAGGSVRVGSFIIVVDPIDPNSSSAVASIAAPADFADGAASASSGLASPIGPISVADDLWGGLKAAKNAWVSARGGLVDAIVTATGGWAYVWAYTDVKGSITSKQTASVTAWNDLSASVTSNEDGVEAFAGHDITGVSKGKAWLDLEARNDIKGDASAGDDQTSGDVVIRAGGNITKAITSTGTADVAAAGNITGPIKATDGWIDVVANGDISGSLTAGAEVTAWAGGKVPAWIIGGLDVDVQAGGEISGYIQSQQGDVSIWTGGDLSSSTVKAKGDVSIEAAGQIFGGLQSTKIEAGGNASVLANGDIITPVEAEWVADVRSVNGIVRSSVVTRRKPNEWFTAVDSPAVQRLIMIDAENAQLQGLQDPASLQRIADLQVERDLLTQQNDLATDWQQFPADRVRAMYKDGLVGEYYGPAYRGQPTQGYAIIPDAGFLGEFNKTSGYTLLLEPFRKQQVWFPAFDGIPGHWNTEEVSLLGSDNPMAAAEYYKVVRRTTRPLQDGETAAAYIRAELSTFNSQFTIKNYIDDKVAGNAALLEGIVQFGLRLVPLVGAFQDVIV